MNREICAYLLLLALFLGSLYNIHVMDEKIGSLRADVGKAYELLATIYEYEGQPEKINALCESAQKITSIRRNSILRKLEDHRSRGETQAFSSEMSKAQSNVTGSSTAFEEDSSMVTRSDTEGGNAL